MNIRLRKLLLLVLLVGITACKPNSDVSEDRVHLDVGEQILYIPKAYIVSGGGEKSALLRAFYPGNIPAPSVELGDLMRSGDIEEAISILITDLSSYENFTPKKGLEGVSKFLGTTEFKGSQYDMRLYINPDEDKRDELWVISDDKDSVSYIICTNGENIRWLNCSHHFYDQGFKYQVSYGKKFLPEWSTLEQNVRGLIGGFKKDAAAVQSMHETD